MSEAESAPAESGAVDVTDPVPETNNEPEVSGAETAGEEGEEKGTEPSAEEKKEAAAKAEAAKKEEARSKHLAAIMRQESELRRKTADVERREKALQEHYDKQVGELKAESERLQSWQKEAVEYLSRIKQDPIGWLKEEMGIDGERYFEMLMNDGKPSKEHALNDQFKLLEKKYSELEKWKADREKAEEEARRRWQEEQAAQKKAEEEAAAKAEYEKAQDEFWGIISTNPSDYGDLAIYPKEVVLDEAAKLVTQLGPKAQEMSYTELARLMQDITREWHDKVRKGGGVVDSKQPPQGEEPSKASEKPAAPAASEIKKTRRAAGIAGDVIKTRTLTADLSASKASAKVGRSWEEEKEAIKRELETRA